MTELRRATAPRRVAPRDWYAPALVAASLLVHVAALVLLVRPPPAAAARPPEAVPIEVVQMPAEKPASSAAKPTPRAEAPADKPVQKSEAPEPRRAERKAETASRGKEAARTAARGAKTAVAPSREPPAAHAGTPDAAAQRNVAERMQQLLGPMPAAVMPAASAGDDPFDDAVSYRQLVLSQLARQRREDRHNGVPGHVVVAFTVGNGGEVVACSVREKSVDPALDAEAVAMVYRGAPYPRPPVGAERSFSFGLAFRPA